MTNNQWKNDKNTPQWEAVGADCSAEVRAKGFAKVFFELSPDVAGLQEVSSVMLAELVQNLTAGNMHYTVIWGADTPIAYNGDKLELLDSYFAYHSESIPLLEGCFNNEKTKSYTIAVFRQKSDGRCFVFANTHLWWKSGEPNDINYQPYSDEAREYQLCQVMNKAQEFSLKYGNCPAFIVGDLNADYDSMALKAAFEHGYLHTHDMAVEYSDETNGTHFCFASGYRGYEPTHFENGIDHILLKGQARVIRFDRYYPNWYMPLSDHFPTYIDAEL